ncbi:MAG: hypothetical protein PHY18_06290 [Dehalococcoidales bacterium]|nr:hypothetical protein [Dehalococcoidales bacterium]
MSIPNEGFPAGSASNKLIRFNAYFLRIGLQRQRSSVVEQRFRNPGAGMPLCVISFKLERLCCL